MHRKNPMQLLAVENSALHAGRGADLEEIWSQRNLAECSIQEHSITITA